jgi:hypothetical protein
MSPNRRLIAAAIALLAVLALPGQFPAASGASSPTPHVSVISDSVLTAVTWNGPAQALLTQGLDMQIDAGVCRRLNGESCEFNGAHVPTTLTVINSWITRLGSIVVIVDGYNDLPANFAGDVELTLDTLRDHGVQHVLWVDLRESRPEFAAKNIVLFTAAKHHPELHVLDWNSYSSAHPEWYQTDAIHLVPAGGVAIATWIRQAIADTISPPPPPIRQALAVAAHQRMRIRAGVHFDGHLRAGGGTAPLRWRTTGAALRKAKLHLLSRGELTGRPTRVGTFTLPVDVTDATGSTAHVIVTITVKPH